MIASQRWLFLLALAGVLAMPACRTSARPAEIATPRATAHATGAFQRCTDRPFATPRAAGFRHHRSGLLATLGRVAHSAQDVITGPGAPVLVPGKFAYGRVSKDLEDEWVDLFVDTCAAWVSLGRAKTNGDGRTALRVAADRLPGVGVYDLVQVVRGDGSTIRSRLTIAPPATHLVVFDVDGTLTISDGELGEELKGEYLGWLASGKRSPRAYADAGVLTQLWAAKGYVVVYMTGRPYWLAELTRAWLEAIGSAPGHLHTTDRNRDALPTQGGVGEFKAAYLRTLIAAGYVIDYAYGNAESDVFAYAKAGVPASRTHIIGEHAGLGGTVGLRGGYTSHLDWVARQARVKQPFVLASAKP